MLCRCVFNEKGKLLKKKKHKTHWLFVALNKVTAQQIGVLEKYHLFPAVPPKKFLLLWIVYLNKVFLGYIRMKSQKCVKQQCRVFAINN